MLFFELKFFQAGASRSGLMTPDNLTPPRPSPSALLARRLAHAKLMGESNASDDQAMRGTGARALDLGHLIPYARQSNAEISYWSETDASQTENETEAEEEDGDLSSTEPY